MFVASQDSSGATVAPKLNCRVNEHTVRRNGLIVVKRFRPKSADVDIGRESLVPFLEAPGAGDAVREVIASGCAISAETEKEER
jgi:hypothetical protein